MKKWLLPLCSEASLPALFLALIVSSFLHSQVPQGIPYQAMIRDNAGAPLVNTAVTVRFTLHQNSINGAVEYQETQALTTNGFGLINTQFGQGTAIQGSFAGIVWSNTSKFIQVEANDGSGYVDMGTQQMMSVPYAMYSGAAATANISNTSVSADNGFSNVSVTGDTLYMANGSFIIVPGISAANYQFGCLNVNACNYDASVEFDDGSCYFVNTVCDDGDEGTVNDVINASCYCEGSVQGCMDVSACNYQPNAMVDNGTCITVGSPCDDMSSYTDNDMINANCQCAGTYNGTGLYTAGSGITDADGNVYTTVIINGQEWMQQNLAVTQYRNGDAIPTGLGYSEWQYATEGAFSIYDDVTLNNDTYGKLYNWFAVNDSRGLCPSGWHVPNNQEWSSLINFLDPTANGGNSFNNAGGKMKSIGLWASPNGGANNESGFTGLPGGSRSGSGLYDGAAVYAYWWSSTNTFSNYNTFFGLNYYQGNTSVGSTLVQNGFSVRCLKDAPVPALQGCTDGAACNFLDNATQDDGSCLYLNATCDDGNANTTNDFINSSCVCAGTAVGNGSYVFGNGATDIDGNTYTSIIINGQEWMQQNLAVTKYRNGDAISTGLSDETWSSTINGAYALYNNDVANNTTYGKLYNWYAVNDSRGVCPTGWHVPSDAEWSTFINYLDPNANGGDTWPNVAGGKLKSTTVWNSPNEGATNESGFTGLPGGYRGINVTYSLIGYAGFWWSSTEYDSFSARNRSLNYSGSNVLRDGPSKQYGFSVRCVRD